MTDPVKLGTLAAGVLLLSWPVATSADPVSEQAPPDRATSVWDGMHWTDLDGRTWTAEELRGRVVVLEFWATWCAPCLAELPSLRSLHEEHGDDGLLILGVALDAVDRRRLRSFLARHGVAWPQVHEPRGVRGDAARRFGVEAVPGTFLVDAEGQIVARDLRGEALRAVVGSLLARRNDGAD